MARVTLDVALVTRLLDASRMRTVMAGLIAVPATGVGGGRRDGEAGGVRPTQSARGALTQGVGAGLIEVQIVERCHAGDHRRAGGAAAGEAARPGSNRQGHLVGIVAGDDVAELVQDL